MSKVDESINNCEQLMLLLTFCRFKKKRLCSDGKCQEHRSRTTKDYQGTAKTIKNHLGLSRTTKDYQGLPKTIKDYQGRARGNEDYQGP